MFLLNKLRIKLSFLNKRDTKLLFASELRLFFLNKLSIELLFASELKVD